MTDVLVYLARDSDNLNFYIKGYIDLKNARIENCSNDADINAFIIHSKCYSTSKLNLNLKQSNLIVLTDMFGCSSV